MDPETQRRVDIDIHGGSDNESIDSIPIPATKPTISYAGSRERLSQMLPILNVEQLADTIRAQYNSEGSSVDLEERTELASVKAVGSDFLKPNRLYRDNTEPWESEDIDDLHYHMSQQFEALTKQGSNRTRTGAWSKVSKHGNDDGELYMCSDYDSEDAYGTDDVKDIVEMEHCLLRAHSTEQIAREKEDMTREMIHLVQLQQTYTV